MRTMSVALAAMYPKWGFIKRSVECTISEDREQIMAAFQASGYELVAESEGKMVFRADNIVRRLMFLLEDEVTLTQCGQSVEIQGIRRAAAHIVYRLDTYMTNKRR